MRRMMLDEVEHIGDLVDGAIRVLGGRRGPGTPLHAIDRAQIAVLVRPLIPNMHVVLQQPVDVGGTLQKPQQLIGQAFEEHGLGGQQREVLRQVKAHLLAEQGNRAGAGAIGLQRAFGQDLAHQVLIGHRNVRFGTCGDTGANICELFFGQSHVHQCSLGA